MKKITLIILKIFIVSSIYAQCTAPTFNVNLSAASDTSWTLTGTSRAGVCCGSSNCIRFNVTLNPNSDLVNFKVSNPSPSGSAFYQVNCGPPVSIGTPFCVAGLASPFTITYCKPGGDRPDFKIIAGSIGQASDDITIRNTGCSDTLFVSNINPSTVAWTSIYPGAPGAYNNYLSCTSGCTSTLVTSISTTPPAYIDFQVSGAPNTLSCGTTCKDTVRVYFVNDMNVSISPPSAVTCAAPGTAVTMTANPTGGQPPYTYIWSNGATTQSISTSTTGTYTVTVSDNTQCPVKTAIKTLAPSPVATFTYTPGSYCKNVGYNPVPTFSGAGTPGTFTATPAGLVFVNANTGEINLAASAPNQYTVTNTVPATGSCPGSSYSATVYILPVPYMTSPSSASICTGGTVNIPLVASFSSSYTWIANNNPNVSGESLTLQTSGTLNNTLINNTNTIQYVTYTVTPTAIIYGNCPGTPQTVTVTVNPLDNAGFYYSSSTVCNTGGHPSPVVTGTTNGSFSGSSGMSINGVHGQINLSSTAVGSYTVTYTTNATCPNSATFPITVTAGPSATFNYPNASYCQNSPNPLPVFPAGSSAGTFSSSSGLVFVSTITGEINLMASTPGTYTIVNTIPPAGGCPTTVANTTITIHKYNAATFNYTGSPYCQNGTDPSPVFTGGGIAGTFTSTSGLTINSATGAINLASSTPGTYTITNTVAANGSCPATSATASVTITALPVTTFSYTGSPYCQNASNPLPTFSGGGTAGTFTASSLFLEVNPSTGLIDLAASTCDNYYVTNYIPAANGCPAVSTIVPVTITPLPIAAFNYTSSPYCQNAPDPTPVVNFGGTNGIFTGSPSGLTVEPNSGTLTLSSSTPGNYTVTNTVPAYNGCPAVIATATVTISPLTPGTFNYPNTPYCKNAANPLPVFTSGSVAGTFSAPAGLVINSTTGEVDLASSAAGTYTVTNTTAPSNGCAGAAYTSTITITPLPVATFGYTGTPYCQNVGTASPTFTGGGAAGVFTSTAGLSINSSTGIVNLTASTVGTYTVTNTIAAANGCPAVTATANITVTPLPIATFSYTGTPYCQNAGTASPTFIGGGYAGTFSSTAGLIINASTGTVNLSASTAGTYTVTNTIAASNGCPAVTSTANITITPLPVATFSYTGTPYCQNEGTASPTFSGGGYAGTFTSTTGLSLNPTTGVVDLASSTPGTYTVTNIINAADGCPAVTATATITITTLPVAAFIYTDSPYCQNAANPVPTFTGGGTAGTFSSTAGLNINSVAGSIDLGASTAGTYMITNTIDAANGCPSVYASTSITITPLPIATFNYSDLSYCQDGFDPLPTLASGAVAGTFTSTSDLAINSSTGLVNLLSSAIGTHTITNTVDAANGCPVVTESVSLTINPIATADAGADAVICEGSSYTLSGTVGGGASSLTWTSNGTGSFDDNTSPTATYTPSSSDITAGSVILTLTTNDPAGPCSETWNAMILTIEPAAIADASSDAVICSGTSYILSGSIGGGASSLTWTTNGSGIFNDASSSAAKYDPSSNDIAAGLVTLTLTTNDPAGVCPAVSDEMAITINPDATANAGPDSSICEGSTFTLSGSIGGGASSLTWTSSGSGIFNDLNSASAVYTPSASDITNGSVILTLTTNDPSGPCNAASDAMTLIIEPAALANAASDAVICSGSVYTLSGNINGGASSLSWSSNGSGSFDNNVSASAVYTPSSGDIASGNITLTLTTNDPAGFCSAVSDDMVLTINPDETVYAGVDTSICSGNSYKLSGSAGGGASGLIWTSNGSGTFDDNTLASATYFPSPADISAGSVILTVTTNDPAGPCTSASDVMTLIINPIPVVNAGLDMSICSGNQYALNGSIGGGASSAVWTSNGSGTFDNTSAMNANYTPSANDIINGSVQFVLGSNDPAGACPSVNDTMILTINPAAVVNVGSDATICEGTEYAVSGAVSGGANSFIWSSNGSGSFDNVNAVNAIYTPSTSDVTSGTVILTATTNDPSGPCASVTDQMILTITPRDNPAFSYSSSTFCETGTNPTPVITGATGGVFSTPQSSLSINSSTGAIDLSASATGSYTVYYTTTGSCPDSSFVTLNISNGLSAAFNYASASYCSNEIDPSPILTPGANSGVFSSTTGLVIDPVSGRINLSASTPGTYTVTNSVAASGGCAQTSSTNTITINQQDNASFSYAASAFCHSSANQLPTVTGAAGGLFSCNTSGIVLNSSGEISISASVPGTYPVTYTTTGICPNSSTMNVTINSLPVVEAGNERLIDCGANPISIDVVDSLGNVVNYSWNTNGGNILSGDGTNSASINQTGLYYVVATNTFGCTACDTVIVTESPVIPEASFTAAPSELTGIVPFELNFNNTSQNANTYNWNFGDQSGGTSVENPNYTFYTAGTYTVTLVASNNGRCADTTDVIVKVEDEFMIPEGFSPNGDGINDVFVIKGIDRFKGNKLVVFNRWGNQVHEAAPYTNQWDGSTNQDIQFGGNELPVGTYFYVLDLGNGTKPYQGYIYLNK